MRLPVRMGGRSQMTLCPASLSRRSAHSHDGRNPATPFARRHRGTDCGILRHEYFNAFPHPIHSPAHHEYRAFHGMERSGTGSRTLSHCDTVHLHHRLRRLAGEQRGDARAPRRPAGSASRQLTDPTRWGAGHDGASSRLEHEDRHSEAIQRDRSRDHGFRADNARHRD